MKKFQVIGGQYESHHYGESDTLRGAKLIATRNMECWDNFQGWHTPRIFLAEDVMEIESRGRVTTRDGIIIRVPNGEPICIKDGKKWVKKGKLK